MRGPKRRLHDNKRPYFLAEPLEIHVIYMHVPGHNGPTPRATIFSLSAAHYHVPKRSREDRFSARIFDFNPRALPEKMDRENVSGLPPIVFALTPATFRHRYDLDPNYTDEEGKIGTTRDGFEDEKLNSF